MSKLEDLIQEFCPDGVEYRSILEIFNTRNGYTPSKSNKEYWENGEIPWFRMEDIRESGRILSKATQYVSRSAVKGKAFPENSIIISTSATIGEHALITVPSLANQRFTYLMLKNEYKDLMDIKFVYYYCFKLDEYCKACLNQGNFASVDMKQFAKFEVPVPPLPVQEKIVRILDNFTELTAELTARKKQYEYYRKELLTFADDVKKVPLIDVVKIKRGVRVVKSQLAVEGEYPVFQNSMTPLGYMDKANCTGDTAFIITAGAAGEIGYTDNDFWAADDCFSFECPQYLKSKYLYYILLCQQNTIYSKVRKASIPRLPRSAIEKLIIPVPSVDIQEKIVDVLDRFDTLCNDISKGLPAEIVARQKQYEYYRDKLLTFKEFSDEN